MTDRYDDMRVPPDPLLAEALRQRLHAHMLQLDAARLESDAHLVPVKEIVVSLNSPTSEAGNRRRLAMAAAAVVAVVGVGAVAISSRNSNDDVEPAPAVATIATPTTVAPRRETGARVNATYTVPDGWENTGYGVIKGDPAIGMTIDYAGADAPLHTSYCVAPGADADTNGNRPSSVSHGGTVGATVDDLVSAWANLPGVDATAARDVTIDGFDGKQIEFTVPDYDAGDCNGLFGFCAYGESARCESYLRDKDFPLDEESYQPLAHQYLKIWILDVNGARHMILAGSSPDTSPQDRAALDEIVASIQFGTPNAGGMVYTDNFDRADTTPTSVEPTTVESTVAARTGTYDVSGVDLTFAVPAGWEVRNGYVGKANSDPILAVGFYEVANIYTGSCPPVQVDPPVGPTVDDLASAWANLPGFDATAVSDITVDGFHGKQVEFTVPDYNQVDCQYGTFRLWQSVRGDYWWAEGPNEHQQLWILDVNGTRLVIVKTFFPDTSPQDRAALDEIRASIQIG